MGARAAAKYTLLSCLPTPSTQRGDLGNGSPLQRLTRATAAALVGIYGFGPDTAATLLVTAASNPERFRSDAAFAALCGVIPTPAPSGKTNRHRLNRGGDRQANAALYRIVVIRLRYDQRTREYMLRRAGEELSKTRVIRCLERYVSREVFAALRTSAALFDYEA